MFSDVRKRAQKAGQAPGTPVYTGNKIFKPTITVIQYSAAGDFYESSGATLEECNIQLKESLTTWINVEGLSDVNLIQQIAERFHLHPLTVEDVLNVQQRPKIEEFENYLFVTLKNLHWNAHKYSFSIEQLSFILGKNFVLSFQERQAPIFQALQDRLRNVAMQSLRQQGADYLFYRFIDNVIDQYFVVLEGLGEQIEKVEEMIIAAPTTQNSRTIYRLKRQLLILRKAIWPLREIINHLTQAEESLISSYTRVYMRDAYDHIVQAIDSVETFRDMLSSMLDVYLSSLTNRMNEIMKVLTIISTIFIPITFVASLYGMNFKYMPELRYKYGYPITLGIMVAIVVVMLIYFRRKKWI